MKHDELWLLNPAPVFVIMFFLVFGEVFFRLVAALADFADERSVVVSSRHVIGQTSLVSTGVIANGTLEWLFYRIVFFYRQHRRWTRKGKRTISRAAVSLYAQFFLSLRFCIRYRKLYTFQWS